MCLRFVFPILVALIFNHSALASSQTSTFDARDFKPDDALMNIYKGDNEINLNGGFGYSSFSGFTANIDLTYRYFFMDHFSMGPIFGFNYSELSKSQKYGISGRWYFYEYDRWAFSLTQNLTYSHLSTSFPGPSRYNVDSFNGLTQLSVHYFFTPEVYLSFSINADYEFANSVEPQKKPDINTQVGFGITF